MRDARLPVVLFAVAMVAVVGITGWYAWHRADLDNRQEVSRTAFQEVVIRRMDAIDANLNALHVEVARLLQVYCTSPDGATRCKPDGTPR